MARSDPEREPKLRLTASVVKLPRNTRFDPAKAVEAWAAIGLDVSEDRILEHNAAVKKMLTLTQGQPKKW
jgi:hypothetical protein